MTIMVGANTPLGTYPITVTGNGGGIQHNFTVTLMVISSVWQQGFDFRGSSNFVTDPPGATDVNSIRFSRLWVTSRPTGGRTPQLFRPRIGTTQLIRGWPASTMSPTARQANSMWICRRRAHIACRWRWETMRWPACSVQCQVQFLDGSTVLATMTGGPINLGYFYDAQGNIWSAAQWPANNVSQPVTLAGDPVDGAGRKQPIHRGQYPDRLRGSNSGVGRPDLRAASTEFGQCRARASIPPRTCSPFSSAASTAPLICQPAGGPAGTSVTFNPSTIPAPGAGTSIMTISVPNNAPLGNYPLTVTAKGGGIVQNVSVVLTVTVADPPSFTLTAPSAVSTAPGGQVTGTVIDHGFGRI